MRRWRKYAQDISDSEPKMIIFGRLIWLKVGKKLIVTEGPKYLSRPIRTVSVSLFLFIISIRFDW